MWSHGNTSLGSHQVSAQQSSHKNKYTQLTLQEYNKFNSFGTTKKFSSKNKVNNTTVNSSTFANFLMNDNKTSHNNSSIANKIKYNLKKYISNSIGKNQNNNRMFRSPLLSHYNQRKASTKINTQQPIRNSIDINISVNYMNNKNSSNDKDLSNPTSKTQYTNTNNVNNNAFINMFPNKKKRKFSSFLTEGPSHQRNQNKNLNALLNNNVNSTNGNGFIHNNLNISLTNFSTTNNKTEAGNILMSPQMYIGPNKTMENFKGVNNAGQGQNFSMTGFQGYVNEGLTGFSSGQGSSKGRTPLKMKKGSQKLNSSSCTDLRNLNIKKYTTDLGSKKYDQLKLSMNEKIRKIANIENDKIKINNKIFDVVQCTLNRFAGISENHKEKDLLLSIFYRLNDIMKNKDMEITDLKNKNIELMKHNNTLKKQNDNLKDQNYFLSKKADAYLKQINQITVDFQNRMIEKNKEKQIIVNKAKDKKDYKTNNNINDKSAKKGKDCYIENDKENIKENTTNNINASLSVDDNFKGKLLSKITSTNNNSKSPKMTDEFRKTEEESEIDDSSVNTEDLESIRFFDKIQMKRHSFSNSHIPELSIPTIKNTEICYRPQVKYNKKGGTMGKKNGSISGVNIRNNIQKSQILGYSTIAEIKKNKNSIKNNFKKY